MARMSPSERRQAIIDAALAVALRKGLAATTVRDVATEMGSSSGLIHHYFDSMDEVLASAFEKAAGQDLDTTIELMAPFTHPVERLAAFFRSYVRADQDWAFQLWLDAWAEAARRPALRESSVRLNIAWQQLLAATIEAGVEEGSMSSDDPEAVAWRIVSLLDGLSLQVVAHRAILDRRTVTSWVVESTEAELGMTPGGLAVLVHSPVKVASTRPRLAR